MPYKTTNKLIFIDNQLDLVLFWFSTEKKKSLKSFSGKNACNHKPKEHKTKKDNIK